MWGWTYWVEMAVPLFGRVQAYQAVVRVQIEQEPLEVGDRSVLRHMDLGESVDGAHSLLDGHKTLRAHGVALVEDDDVRMRDL